MVDIGTGEMNLWAGPFTPVHQLLRCAIGVKVQRSCGSDRRDARGQIESSETGIRRNFLFSPFGRVKEMIMHSHEPGNSGSTAQIQDFCIRWNVTGAAERFYPALLNQDCLVLPRRCTAAVDHANVSQSDQGSINGNEFSV